MGHVREKAALGLAGAFGLFLGFAQLARARRDELLEPLAVRADFGHVLNVSEHLDGVPAVVGDGRHDQQRPQRVARRSDEVLLDGVGLDLADEKSPGLRFDRFFVGVAEDVVEPTRADLLGGRAQNATERAVDPEKPSVGREQRLPDGRVLEGRLELPLGGGQPCASRRVLAREEEGHAEDVDHVRPGAQVRCPDFREVDEDPDRGSAQDRRRADGEEGRARPIALPDSAGDEESVDLDREHQEILDGEGRAGRRSDGQQARAAPGQRHRSQLEDRSAHRHPQVQDGEEDQPAHDERAEDTVAASAELRIDLQQQHVDDHADRDEPVERDLGLRDRRRAEERAYRQAEDGVEGTLDREHEEDPLVTREPPVDRVVDRGAREEPREPCVYRAEGAHS